MNTHWIEGIRLVVSLSMQFEAGAQGERDNGAPFPPLREAVPDLPAATWFDYGVGEGIPRMLGLWDRYRVPVTSHMVGCAVEATPALARAHQGAGRLSALCPGPSGCGVPAQGPHRRMGAHHAGDA